MDVSMSPDEHDFDCCLHIRAYAGGPEARQFAGLVLRMYCRWAERAGVRHKVGEVVDGAEGGVERATLRLAGEGVRERVSGEHGAHRLIRIAPGETRRGVSFVIVEVLGAHGERDATSPDTTKEQIRTYTFDPSESVTDDRTGLKVSDAEAVLDGDLTAFIPAAPVDRR
jgi:peptide chain release factor 2